mmetsp:Transcript_38946/g.81689  ORF Transcript_38946/g.81689 Transcript_38946/m.81689 type:complete len:103 (-) Transcript_38946:89-397(-)
MKGMNHVADKECTGKLPPPPQSYRRKDKNQVAPNIDVALPCDQIGVAGFRAAQRRYIVSQLLESEFLAQSKGQHQELLSKAESLLLWDIVLNSPLDRLRMSQ